MQEIISLISSLGFPIVVSLWFMMRTEKVISANTEAMNRNSTLMTEILSRLK